MNFRSVNDFRDKRNQFVNMPYVPMHYSLASYCTDSHKEEMRATFGDEFFSSLPMVADPLKKNLADTFITAEAPVNRKTKNSLEQNNMGSGILIEPPDDKIVDRAESYAFSGITNFISGVFNVISGAMFQKRPKSPANQHYDNFNYADDRKRSPGDNWQTSKIEDQNINRRAQEQNGEKEIYKTNMMNSDYRSPVLTCREKINEVRMLLKPVQKPNRYLSRRPKKQFVEAGTYDEVFEDAFTPEDFVTLANQSILKHRSPVSHQKPVLLETASPKLRTYTTPLPSLLKGVPKKGKQCVSNKNAAGSKGSALTAENAIVSSCEEKLNKLKAILKETKKPLKSILKNGPKPETETKETSVPKVHDKHYKKPHRTTVKRKKMHRNKRIQEDLLFANEIESECLSSVESSPRIKREVLSDPESISDSFDEVTGRFRNVSTTESDDSFQIVFTDDTPPTRSRKVSECDSEDSFIVFEDFPGTYTSADVFQDDDSGSESDCESDASDSGCSVSKLCKLKANLSRTISDLTDDSLYEDVCKCQSEDEVDCAFKSVVELRNGEIKGEDERKTLTPEPVIDEKPVKRVQFSPAPPQVRVMRVWAFAARQARVGRWERDHLDRARFQRRIADVEMAVSWVLKPQHRSRVMFQRFMPWWNALRRKELAEKKQKAEDARILAEEEQRIKEAQEEEDRMKEELEKLERGETVEDGNSEMNGDASNGEGNTSVIVDNNAVLTVNGIDNDIDSNDLKTTVKDEEVLVGNASSIADDGPTVNGNDNDDKTDKIIETDCELPKNNVENTIVTSNTLENSLNDKTLNVNNNYIVSNQDSLQANGSSKNDAQNSQVATNSAVLTNSSDSTSLTSEVDFKRLDSTETKIEKICDKLADLKISNGISLDMSGT